MSVEVVLTVLRFAFVRLFEFAKTWIGGFVLAFAIAWLWSGHRHDAACDARIAAEHAEAEREAAAKRAEWDAASTNIKTAAAVRAKEDARGAERQAGFIQNLTGKEERHVPTDKDFSADASHRPLFLDRDYIAVVRAFDAAGNRDADPAGAAREFRKASAIARSKGCAALKVFCLRNRAAATTCNRRQIEAGRFYDDVLRNFSAKR